MFSLGLLRRCLGVAGFFVLVAVFVFFGLNGASADGATASGVDELSGEDAVKPAFSGEGKYGWLGREPNPDGIWEDSEVYCDEGFDLILVKADSRVDSVTPSCFKGLLINGDEELHGVAKGGDAGSLFNCEHYSPVNAVAVRAGDEIDALAFGCVEPGEGLDSKQIAGEARDVLEGELYGGNGGDLYGIVCKDPDHVIVRLRFYSSSDNIVGIGGIRCALPAGS